MEPGRLGVLVLATGAALGSASTDVSAQSWRLRLDARAQMAAFRGVELDSVLASSVVAGPTGGPVTPEGAITRCTPEFPYCYFFRPGGKRTGGPAVTTADLSLWGLGTPGLRVRVHTRAGVDLGDADVWPGLDPTLQLIEGYAEYATSSFTGRLGRQLVVNRLGWLGFDGARVTATAARVGLTAELYGGLGLGQATALPVSSPALDPLDEFEPRSRQLLFGGSVQWRRGPGDVRLEYQREVDRDTRNFWSERLALSGALRLTSRFSLDAGTEYDVSNSWFGTSELRLNYGSRPLSATAGVRQYRPFFPLWTIWGAFSPVPYRAAHASVWVNPVQRLQVRASTEYFEFSDPEAETPLAQVDDDGWRSGIGATWSPSDAWRLDAGYRLEYGPGASVDGLEGTVTFRGFRGVAVTAYGATLTRPLEFRLNESQLQVVGLDVDWQALDRLRLALGGAYYHEDRERPDASAFDWNQARLHARVTWMLASGPDAAPLPPAVRWRPAAGVHR
jgi:hypothetical protein